MLNLMAYLKFCLLCFCCTYLSGCVLMIPRGIEPKVAYEGDRLPIQQEVTLIADSSHKSFTREQKLYVMEVDGMSLRDVYATVTGQFFPYPQVAFLKPGSHEVKIGYWRSMSYATGRVLFEGEAGHTYFLASQEYAGTVSLWVKNSLGEIVSTAVVEQD